jgi:hypothetical protein
MPQDGSGPIARLQSLQDKVSIDVTSASSFVSDQMIIHPDLTQRPSQPTICIFDEAEEVRGNVVGIVRQFRSKGNPNSASLHA